MSDKAKTWITVLASFFGLFAVIGRDVMPVLMGIPALASAYAAGLPLGLWSVFGSLVVSMSVWTWAIVYLPNLPDGSRPQFVAAMLALMVAVGVTMTQAIGMPIGVKLNAAWMGLAAGCAAPIFGNGIRSIFVHTTVPK